MRLRFIAITSEMWTDERINKFKIVVLVTRNPAKNRQNTLDFEVTKIADAAVFNQ